MNAIVYSSKEFKKYRELSSLIIDKFELYECFMKRFDELMDRFSLSFSFVNCLFFRYRLKSLKNEFSITNVLCHLLCCSRSHNSTSYRKECSRLFVENVDDYVSSIKYHFSLVFTNDKNFNKEIELLFVQSFCLSLKAVILIDAKQNCCINFIIAKHQCEIVIFLSEVYLRILTNHLVSISNDIFCMKGEYGLLSLREKRDLLLD